MRNKLYGPLQSLVKDLEDKKLKLHNDTIKNIRLKYKEENSYISDYYLNKANQELFVYKNIDTQEAKYEIECNEVLEQILDLFAVVLREKNSRN